MTRDELADRVIAGDSAALARAISVIDERRSGHRELVAALHTVNREAPIVGITGSPGTGKSTLVDRLIETYRDRDETVGVIGVDPTSPFSGGAILGDRIRMESARGDPGVFIRSLSTQGTLGGLSPAVDDVLTAFEAFGMDRIIVETVGAGQNEIDIVRSAESVVVVVQPAHGDDIQLLKAGIAEIADLFVVNKADLANVDRTVRQLRRMVEEADTVGTATPSWDPPILETIATENTGVEAVVDQLVELREQLSHSGRLADRRRGRYEGQLRRILQAEVNDRIQSWLDEDGISPLIEDILNRDRDPYGVAAELIDRASGEDATTS